MTTKILTALAALTLFTAASARTLEHYLDTGSGEGGSSMTASASSFEVTFSAALSDRLPVAQLTASNADLAFQARAPRTFRVSFAAASANLWPMQLQASTEVRLQARGPMKFSRKSA